MFFLVKAAPYCPSAEKATRGWSKTLEKSEFKLGPTQKTITKEETKRTREEKEQLLRVVEDMAVAEDTLKRVQEFMAAAQDSGPSKLNTSIYSKVYFSSALSELIAQNWTNREKATHLLKSNDDFLNSSLKQFDKAYEFATAYGSGSNFNSYALAAAVLASPQAPENAVERMKAIVEYRGDPRAIPYTPHPPPSVPSAEPNKPNESHFRQGSARSVPFQLALYLAASDEADRKHRQKDMLLVLRNYLEYSSTLKLHALRDASDATYPNFQHTFPDWLAPYYYYPSVPYATAATAVLLRRKDLTEGERKELESMQQQLKTDILSMLRKDGLFQPEFPGILGTGFNGTKTVGGTTYANPLAGLALLPLLRSCSGEVVPKSNRILRSVGITPLRESFDKRHAPPLLPSPAGH